MNLQRRGSGLTLSLLMLIALAGYAPADGQSPNQGAVVTLKGSMVCNGACVPDPKAKGIIKDNWSIGTHEFITEKPDYAGQKFRVIVEMD